MSGRVFVVAILALALASSQVTCVSAIAKLCDANASPAAPQRVRVESQKWLADKRRVEVIIAFDNPTTERTGCITSYTVSLLDAKNTALGAKVSLSNPITNPIRHTVYLTPDSKYTVPYAETETAAGRKARTTVNLQFTTIKAPAPPSGCSSSAAPAAAKNARIVSQVFDSSRGRTKVTFAWDNPTTSSTGCITWYTVSIRDVNGQALGAKYSMSSPTTNPVTSTSYLMPGQRYTWSYVETETATGAKTRTPVELTFVVNGPIALPATTAASG